MTTTRLFGLFLLPLLFLAPAVHAAPEYTITPFGPGITFAGLNNAGVVVGTASDPLTQARAIVHQESGTSVLAPDFGATWGRAINDAGQIAVAAASPIGAATQPWIVSGGVGTPIGSLGYDVAFTTVDAINNAGQVTGASGHAYLFGVGQGMVDLGTLGGAHSWGRGLNDAATVVGGSSFDTSGRVRAFIYSGGAMRDLGTLGGSDSEALAVNNRDIAVGWASAADDHLTRRAVLYAGGTVTDLGALPGDTFSMAYDINDAGEIVGASGIATGRHAFLYRDGAMLDLNDLIDPAAGFLLVGASVINEAHQILAVGRDAAGVSQYLLLSPIVPVPEPASAAMLAAGLGLLAARRARRGQRATRA